MDKPYKRLQSQGQGQVKNIKKKAYRCSQFNAYCLLSCRGHATLIFLNFVDPLWSCIKVKVIETCIAYRASMS